MIVSGGLCLVRRLPRLDAGAFVSWLGVFMVVGAVVPLYGGDR